MADRLAILSLRAWASFSGFAAFPSAASSPDDRVLTISSFFSTVAGTMRSTKMLGKSTSFGSIAPISTISSASTMVTFAALAISGANDLVVYRNVQFPALSAFDARRIATSPGSAVSIMNVLPPNSLVSRFAPRSTTSPPGPMRTGIPPVCTRLLTPVGV